ncbi:fungal transcriptional regulatory protein [Grosmannia clavigera kw1407]|uniref:Fungal transcriptional regulatory protein n=1 Tax=Grosmannia clavigera (strain kw1407 / UAMH 11150) TaxID=655863 RepID=F0XIK5_GROCL|nr:fungal transcriptional regulatory protein [Grosmannia clavigera kw1407]EFX02515.1 fungal transcriptional regulatory protein [Grosmannia clavigera kw1407]
MTVPLNVQPPKAADVAVAASAAAVRKRRRRAPTGGAADDCFTCSKRNIKCDRRRPYCSQCLEVGNECSGYKTQLTWGVGVASRGKLRGLSLPIAKAPPVNPGIGSGVSKKSITSTPARQRAESVASAVSSWNDSDVLAVVNSANMSARGASSIATTPRALRDDVELAFDTSSSMSTPSFNSYELAHMSPGHVAATSAHMSVSVSVPASLAHQNWTPSPVSANLPPFSSSLPADSGPYSQQHQHQHQQRHPHQRQLPHPHPHHQQHQQRQQRQRQNPGPELHLSASIDSLSDVDYMSPISHSFPPDEINFMNSPAGMVYDSFTGQNSPVPQSPTSSLMIEHRRPAPTSCPSLIYATSEQSSSLPSSHPENYDSNLSARLLQDCDSMGTPSDIDAYSTSAQSAGQYWGPYGDEDASPPMRSDAAPAAWPAMMDGQNTSINLDLIAKMPFFIDYYENTMCPSMVFIDGPTNPFRYHIMQLARSSRSLQHAICALAACNLRMKRKLSRGQHRRDVSDAVDDSAGQGDQSVSEEYQHRNMAVHLLNEQLNDPVKSRHDSVLATILLLCHYRMAESGIARFHTHFAGVKKILAMRRASPFPPSRDYAWMEALFTYFDAISASINDRESQLDNSVHGASSDAQILPPGSENLVGCDRELFRTIIKLGRLNLLSQSRQVKGPASRGSSSGSSGSSNNGGNNSAIARALSSRSQSPLGSALGQLYSPTSSHPRQHHPRHINTDVYNNRYGSSLDDEDMLLSPTAYEDQRLAFWTEWKEARLALQSWEFDSQQIVNGLHGVGTPTPAQLRDLCSLSEAFRYAALLYTERLANPNAPSTDSSFRNFVSQVVYYATSLETGSSAEKFLLWPLFVAGSECVNELQQTIVRSKCREIMSRSGYMNNLAALDVLEHLWANNGQEEGGVKGDMACRAPFSWNRCIGGPGIEVEWIMF